METAIYRRSLNGERASERQRRLAVNQFRRKSMRRFESCRSHLIRVKRAGGEGSPSTPNGSGTGLLSRPELVRAQPTARNERGPEALLAKHSALTRAKEVRFLPGPRCSGSANGRPLRSERRDPGSSPGPGTKTNSPSGIG